MNSTHKQRMRAKRIYLDALYRGATKEKCVSCGADYRLSANANVEGWYICPACYIKMKKSR